MATLVELTANIVTSNVSGSGLSADDLVAEINKVFVALKALDTNGVPEGTRRTQSDEPMVLAFSSPVYSQMDISEMPVFEDGLQKQYQKRTQKAATKTGKKAPKALAHPAKENVIPPKKKVVSKEAVAPKAAKDKNNKVKA